MSNLFDSPLEIVSTSKALAGAAPHSVLMSRRIVRLLASGSAGQSSTCPAALPSTSDASTPALART